MAAKSKKQDQLSMSTAERLLESLFESMVENEMEMNCHEDDLTTAIDDAIDEAVLAVVEGVMGDMSITNEKDRSIVRRIVERKAREAVSEIAESCAR